MNKNERGLELRMMKVSSLIEDSVQKHFGVTFWKPRKEDEYRLIRLLQWEEKYCVSVDWILKTLVPIWKNKYSKYQGKGIGVTIPTLCGKKSEEILVQYVREQFPEAENVQAHRALQQESQWRLEWEQRRRVLWDEPTEAIAVYRRAVGKERESRRRFAQQQKKRPYRGNPWR